MKLRPLQDRVLIRRVGAEARPPAASSSPTRAQEKPMEAKSSPSVPAPATRWQAAPARHQERRSRAVREVVGTEVKLDGERPDDHEGHPTSWACSIGRRAEESRLTGGADHGCQRSQI